MYNRYIPGADGYTRVVVEERPQRDGNTDPTSPQSGRRTHQGKGNSFGGIPFLGGEDKNAGIAGILKSLHLEDLDSGDLLLLLIILFLVMEGDHLEQVITLGLMLLLGLGEERSNQKE